MLVEISKEEAAHISGALYQLWDRLPLDDDKMKIHSNLVLKMARIYQGESDAS